MLEELRCDYFHQLIAVDIERKKERECGDMRDGEKKLYCYYMADVFCIVYRLKCLISLFMLCSLLSMYA